MHVLHTHAVLLFKEKVKESLDGCASKAVNCSGLSVTAEKLRSHMFPEEKNHSSNCSCHLCCNFTPECLVLDRN